MNVYARFDEIPSITLKDIKKIKRYGRADGQRENSIPAHKHNLRGGIMIFFHHSTFLRTSSLCM